MDDKIHVTNSDGSVEVLSTNWDAMRRERELEEQKRLLEARKAVQANQQKKREKSPTKQSGRGC